MDVKKYLRTQITLYEEDKKEEASIRCSLLHGSWDQILQRCPSVTPFWLPSHHQNIMKCSGVITKDQGKVHANDQGQRLKVKVREVTTQLNRFQTVTPVWIHIWWWNGTYSWMLLRRSALLFSRSSIKFQGHTALKIVEFDPDWAFPDCNTRLNSPMATKWCTKLEVA